MAATTWYSIQLERSECYSDKTDDLKKLAYEFMERENMPKAVQETFIPWEDMNEEQKFHASTGEESDIVFSYKFSADARIVGALFLDENMTVCIVTMTDELFVPETFTERQVNIAKAFGELWELLVDTDKEDTVKELCDLWTKICDTEGIPHISADEVRNI